MPKKKTVVKSKAPKSRKSVVRGYGMMGKVSKMKTMKVQKGKMVGY